VVEPIMIVETHSHTSEYSSCSHVPAVDLVRRACEVGIQTIMLTDHHHQWGPRELADLRKRAGTPESFQILAGQEVDAHGFGHLLVYGARRTIPKKKITLEQIRRENPDAAIIWAHPYRDKKIPPPERLLHPLIDGVEVMTSNYTVTEAARALRDWHTHKFTATAGTDTHGLSYTGAYPTVFDHPFGSIKEMVAEIKAGRCRPYVREVPLAGTTNTEVTELGLGLETAGAGRPVIVKTFESIEAWAEGDRTYHIVRHLHRHGFGKGPYCVPEPLEEDAASLSLAEERVAGISLFDALVHAAPPDMPHYLELAAAWLARLHNARFRITPADEYLQIEPGRLDYYLTSLAKTGNKHLDRVREIRDLVWQKEQELIRSRPEVLVQGHGDYHPKNIYVAREDSGECVTAIDFDSSYLLPQAFDVGTFLAQYVNMFFHERAVQRHASADLFLHAYLDQARDLPNDFLAQVDLYRARTCLSILYYLAKVRLGEDESFWRILVEAERSLTAIAARKLGRPTKAKAAK
jgi:3',5'-nucleoside bisphosphate phosphatase